MDQAPLLIVVGLDEAIEPYWRSYERSVAARWPEAHISRSSNDRESFILRAVSVVFSGAGDEISVGLEIKSSGVAKELSVWVCIEADVQTTRSWLLPSDTADMSEQVRQCLEDYWDCAAEAAFIAIESVRQRERDV